MTKVITLASPSFVLSTLGASANKRGQRRFLECFAVTIRNARTPKHSQYFRSSPSPAS